MALPSEFSEVEHLQATIRRYLNREIRNHFSDLGDRYWEPEVTTSRGSMRHALTHKDEDPMQVTVARMMLYYFTYGKQHELPAFIDMTDRPFEEFVYRPEVTLIFRKHEYIGNGKYEQFAGEISYRVINETSESLTPAKNKIRAERIKRLFTNPTRFIWHKGKLKFTYQDYKNGYYFRLLATNETEAKRVIKQVLDIENKTPNWDKLSTNTPERQSTTTQQTKLIYGENRKVPRWRPVADVPFVRATMKIHGIPKPVPLVDCISGVPIVQVTA